MQGAVAGRAAIRLKHRSSGPRVARFRQISSARTIDVCPNPSCPCFETPDGLEIDRESRLRNTVSFHSRHIVVDSSSRIWSSRFEDDSDSYAAKVKHSFGKNGALFDPRNSPLVSAASFAHENGARTESARMLIFPDFLRIPHKFQQHIKGHDKAPISDDILLESASQKDVDFLLTVLGSHLRWPNGALARSNLADNFKGTLNRLPIVEKPTILVCGHGARDERCGVLGPLLDRQFQEILRILGIEADVAQITHIGSHKFAGNVILYIPPAAASSNNPLAGKSIWYGRVEPRHCEGIVKETILKGKIIEELYRGSMVGAGP